MAHAPEDFDAEQAVLSSIMQRLGALPEVLEMGITVDSFWTPTNQKLWLAINDAATAAPKGSDTLDPTILLRFTQGRAPELSLFDVTKLFTLVGTSHNVRWHAQTLLDLEQRRDLAAMGRDLEQRASNMADDPEDLIYDVEERLTAHAKVDAGMQTLSEALGMTQHWTRQNSTLGLLGLSSGFAHLDDITNGLQPSQLIVLAARPSKGKSALAWQIAMHAAQRGPVAFFSLEMDARSLVLRALCQLTSIPIADLARNRMPEHKEEAFEAAVKQLRSAQLHIDDRGSLTLHALKAKCKKLHRQEPLSLIVVDYLQLMQVGKASTREQEVSQISRGLKALAMDLGVPVLACAQLNRAIEMRTGEASRPTLSDLRDSGQIEQDADGVWMLWWGWEHCSDLADGDCELLVRKNRNGPLGTQGVDWSKERVAFAERD